MEGDSTGEGVDNQPPAPDAAPSATFTASATHWLPILQRLAEQALAHLDVQEMLRELLDRICATMAVDYANILLLNEDGTHLNVFATRLLEVGAADQGQVVIGHGLARTIAASGKPMIIDDLSQTKAENPLPRAKARSLIGVPLLSRGRVIGVIYLKSIYPCHFNDEDSQMLQVIATNVALAIEHGKRFESEITTRQMQAIQAVSDVALEHARLNDLLHALLPRIQLMLEVENVAILLLAPNGQELTLYSVHGPEEAVMGMVHVPIGKGVAGSIAATREPLIIENLAFVPVANPFLQEHFHSLLGVPLLANDRLIGVIHVDSVQLRHFTIEEREMLEALADRIAIAISRSQQYERAQQSRIDAEHRVAVLQEATTRMGEFLGIASHELRTPLTSLSLNIQLLNRWLSGAQDKRAGESEAEFMKRTTLQARPLLQKSIHGIQRLDRLVSDLLDASRIREHRLALHMRRTDLVGVVHEAVDEQRQIHSMHTMRLEMHVQTPVVVEADPDLVGQVVSNYIGNAFKYSRPDRPVTITLQVKDDQARVSVSDEGIGIPETEHEQIWECFYRVEDTPHQSGSQVGLGLGLYISRDIIERHGGQVGVHSAPGEGSTFWFTLPLA